MRTILALATTVLLFAPGCGDTSTAMDMTVASVDMTATTGADMTKTCAAIFGCAEGCFTNTMQMDPVGCATGCAMGASGVPLANYQKLVTCLETTCATMLDGGAAETRTCAIGAAAGACKADVGACTAS